MLGRGCRRTKNRLAPPKPTLSKKKNNTTASHRPITPRAQNLPPASPLPPGRSEGGGRAGAQNPAVAQHSPPPAHEKQRDHDQPLPHHAKHLLPPRSHRRCRSVKPEIVAGGVRGQNAALAEYPAPPGHIKTATAPRATATPGHTASSPAHPPSPQFTQARGGGRAGADKSPPWPNTAFPPPHKEQRDQD